MDEIKRLVSVYYHGVMSKDEKTRYYAFSRRMSPDVTYNEKESEAFMREGMETLEQFRQSLPDNEEIERVDVYESIDTETYGGDSRPGMVVTYRMTINRKTKR